MGEKKARSYRDQGQRLRDRRQQLERDGKLGDLKTWVTGAGVTVSAYLAYERGEYWPKGDTKRKLAKALGFSEIEFDHGPQPKAPIESPEVNRLVMAFGWLTDAQRSELLRRVEADAATNKIIAREIGPKIEFKTDESMLENLKKHGDFPPGTKKRPAKAGKRRAQPFKEEDPE